MKAKIKTFAIINGKYVFGTFTCHIIKIEEYISTINVNGEIRQVESQSLFF